MNVELLAEELRNYSYKLRPRNCTLSEVERRTNSGETSTSTTIIIIK
jgi:hypothetical protein